MAAHHTPPVTATLLPARSNRRRWLPTSLSRLQANSFKGGHRACTPVGWMPGLCHRHALKSFPRGPVARNDDGWGGAERWCTPPRSSCGDLSGVNSCCRSPDRDLSGELGEGQHSAQVRKAEQCGMAGGRFYSHCGPLERAWAQVRLSCEAQCAPGSARANRRYRKNSVCFVPCRYRKCSVSLIVGKGPMIPGSGD